MNADITVVAGHLVYGQEDCMCDELGRVFGSMTCPKCHGTQRTKGGKGKGRCNTCLGGTVHDPNPQHKVICSCCNGTHKVAANRCSTVPDSIVASLPFRVFRSDRKQTIVEHVLGVGLYSCTDYGRHQEMSDDDLIAAVRKSSTSVQATKIAKDDGTLCTFVGIFCNHAGYTVMGVWE